MQVQEYRHLLICLFIVYVVGKLMEMHGEATTSTSGGKGGSTKVERSYEPPVQESV